MKNISCLTFLSLSLIMALSCETQDDEIFLGSDPEAYNNKPKKVIFYYDTILSNPTGYIRFEYKKGKVVLEEGFRIEDGGDPLLIHTKSFEYDKNGNLKLLNDNGNIHYYEYDLRGRLTKEVYKNNYSGSGWTETFDYPDDSHVIKTKLNYTMDSLSQEIKTLDEEGKLIQKAFYSNKPNYGLELWRLADYEYYSSGIIRLEKRTNYELADDDFIEVSNFCTDYFDEYGNMTIKMCQWGDGTESITEYVNLYENGLLVENYRALDSRDSISKRGRKYDYDDRGRLLRTYNNWNDLIIEENFYKGNKLVKQHTPYPQYYGYRLCATVYEY